MTHVVSRNNTPGFHETKTIHFNVIVSQNKSSVTQNIYDFAAFLELYVNICMTQNYPPNEAQLIRSVHK